MCESSCWQGALDIAILSTDGAVAEIAQGGTYRIVSSFVSSPLSYGVYVSAGTSNVYNADECKCLYFVSANLPPLIKPL